MPEADATPDVVVDWPFSHDALDDFEQIRCTLEAGGDEGPLLILVSPRPSPRWTPAEPLIFKDVDCYIAFLASDDDRLADERWAGLVRGSARDNGPLALAALDALKSLVPARRKKRPGTRRELEPPPPTHVPVYAPLRGPFPSARDLVVVSVGEGWRDVADAFPALSRRVEVKRAP